MVSIIIPVRNSETFIRECLESILSQDLPRSDYEVLISDNQSTDHTIEVINDFLSKPGREHFKMVQQEANLGVYGNLSYLLRNARFDCIHILCADDTYHDSSSLRRVRDAFTSALDVSVFAFDNDTCHTKGSHWQSISAQIWSEQLTGSQSAKFLFTYGCFLGGLSNIGLNRKLLPPEAQFDATLYYYGDFEFYARLALRGSNFKLVRESITRRRSHLGSISSTGNRSNSRTHESILTVALLSRALAKAGFPRLFLRIYASWQATQFYHGAIKELLLSRSLNSWRNVARAHRDLPEFFSPPLLTIFAIVGWPRPLRTRLYMLFETRILAYLFAPTAPDLHANEL